jgi:hypothetical protein
VAEKKSEKRIEMEEAQLRVKKNDGGIFQSTN